MEELENDKYCGTCDHFWGDGDYYCFKDKVLETIKDKKKGFYIGMFWKYVLPETIGVAFTN